MRTMNARKTIVLFGAATLLALPACSSLPERNAPSTYRASLDSEVMAVVETKAAQTGTEVYWINPPKKTKKD